MLSAQEKYLRFDFLVGKGGDLVDRGDNTYGGKYVVNPSGGLISKGHPLGATGTFFVTFTKFILTGSCDI